MRLDVGRALTFAFEDPDWVVKMLVGALIFLVGLVFSIVLIGLIPLIMLSGYQIAVARNVAEGKELPLPSWDNFGELLADGFRVLVATFIWAIPIIVLSVPTLISWLLVSGEEEGIVAAFGLLGLLTCSILLLLFLLLLLVVSPVITWIVARERAIGPALNVRRVLNFIRRHPGDVIIVALMNIAVETVAETVGTLLCIIGLFPAYIWYLWVMGHYIGQLGRLELEDEAALAGATGAEG